MSLIVKGFQYYYTKRTTCKNFNQDRKYVWRVGNSQDFLNHTTGWWVHYLGPRATWCFSKHPTQIVWKKAQNTSSGLLRGQCSIYVVVWGEVGKTGDTVQTLVSKAFPELVSHGCLEFNDYFIFLALEAFWYFNLSAKMEIFPGKECFWVGITLLATENENGKLRAGERQKWWPHQTSFWPGHCFYHQPRVQWEARCRCGRGIDSVAATGQEVAALLYLVPARGHGGRWGVQYKIKRGHLRGMATLICKSRFMTLLLWLDWAFSKCLNKSTLWPIIKIASLNTLSRPFAGTTALGHSIRCKKWLENTHHQLTALALNPCSQVLCGP